MKKERLVAMQASRSDETREKRMRYFLYALLSPFPPCSPIILKLTAQMSKEQKKTTYITDTPSTMGRVNRQTRVIVI